MVKGTTKRCILQGYRSLVYIPFWDEENDKLHTEYLSVSQIKSVDKLLSSLVNDVKEMV